MKNGIKTIKEKVFTLLFPSKKSEILELETVLKIKNQRIDNLDDELDRLKEQIYSALPTPEPTIADLMRDTLELVRTDYVNVEDATGLPQHPLNGNKVGKQLRELRIAELANIFKTKSFRILCDYLVSVQANHTFRKGKNFDELMAGRFTVNGIDLILKELKSANTQYEEASKPPDSEDETDDLDFNNQ